MFSATSAEDYLFDVSIEALLNINVVTAGKQEESLTASPGVVSVITAEDIRDWGVRNLAELLNRMPNTVLLDAHHIGRGKLSLRSVNPSPIDSSILILLNGRPIRDSGSGGFNSDLYRNFPVSAIAQIEFVRGPGSPLYGSNAFAGYLNIITRSAQDSNHQAELMLTVGEYGVDEQGLNLYYRLPQLDISLSALNYNGDGKTISGITDNNGVRGDYETFEQGQLLLSEFNVGNLSLQLLYGDSKQADQRALFQFPTETLKTERLFSDLQYRHDINDLWYLLANYSQSHQDIRWAVNNSGLDNRVDTRETIAELALFGEHHDFRYIFGISEQTLQGEDQVGGLDYQGFNKHSGYFSVNWSLTQKQNIYFGGQWNKPETSDSHYSARLGYIHQLEDNLTLKAFYGEAFRSPFGIELFVDAPGLVGNSALKPETIATFDMQLIKHFNQANLTLTLYHSNHKDMIIRDASQNPPSQANGGKIDYKGMELEFQWQLSAKNRLFGNYSWQSNSNQQGEKQLSFGPKSMFKIGLTHKASDKLLLNVFYNYNTPQSDLSKQFEIDSVNPKPNSLHNLFANINYKFELPFGSHKRHPLTLSLHVENLLNERHYVANMRHRSAITSIPGKVRRQVYLSLQSRW